MRLLLIEDNMKLADTVKLGLEKNGFHIDTAHTAEDGEYKLSVNEYDAVLLDLNLPDKDGLDILKDMRGAGISLPAIILSARDEIEQRALGLDQGADDYITKPFELLELRARIQAVIRRFHGRTNPLITIKGLSVNPASRTVQIGSIPVCLLAKEFDILEYLAERYPAVVSSEELAEHVYDENYDPFSSVLRVHIARLRKKLTDAAGKDILQTIRGKGYSLCID